MFLISDGLVEGYRIFIDFITDGPGGGGTTHMFFITNGLMNGYPKQIC
jgi:hypothetical protein